MRGQRNATAAHRFSAHCLLHVVLCEVDARNGEARLLHTLRLFGTQNSDMRLSYTVVVLLDAYGSGL